MFAIQYCIVKVNSSSRVKWWIICWIKSAPNLWFGALTFHMFLVSESEPPHYQNEMSEQYQSNFLIIKNTVKIDCSKRVYCDSQMVRSIIETAFFPHFLEKENQQITLNKHSLSAALYSKNNVHLVHMFSLNISFWLLILASTKFNLTRTRCLCISKNKGSPVRVNSEKRLKYSRNLIPASKFIRV